MLYDFLIENADEILALTAKKSRELAGVRPSSELLKQGLPIFLTQLSEVLKAAEHSAAEPKPDIVRMEKAASNENEVALAAAAGHPEDAKLALTAGAHAQELLRLGYTISHVVHAYGAMCQSITEIAGKKNIAITAQEFHNLNRCLDVAIAGAVSEFQSLQNTEALNRGVEHLGFLAHELRNALNTIKISLSLIRNGTVGFGGSTSKILDRGIKRVEELVDRSLAEVRMSVDPKVHTESINLLSLMKQICVTADVEAQKKEQILEFSIDPMHYLDADTELFYSALSNIIQNASKYTHRGGLIQIRSKAVGAYIEIEVEDRCGGLKSDVEQLFKSFEQHNEDRTGLGLGLSIAARAIALNRGTIRVRNVTGKGCIFTIALPRTIPK